MSGLPIPFIHRWLRGKWGSGLDCRICRWCGRFEIVGYGYWYKADRAHFPDATFPGELR